jgi:hypothetical protein
LNVFWTYGRTRDLNTAFQKRLRSRIMAQIVVSHSHHVHQVRLEFGVVDQTRVDIACGFLERRAL